MPSSFYCITPNGRLLHYTACNDMEVRAGAVPIDICTTTATHRHLYHHVTNGLMRVVLTCLFAGFVSKAARLV